MNPEELTIEMLEEEVGMPADKWHGKCHEIAWAADKLLGDSSVTAPYGHYLGPIDPDGYWGGRQGFPNHHGWVLLKDGRVLDPTRFSFENKEPYIFISEDGSDYDEGGNKIRAAMQRPCPSAMGGQPAELENLKEYEVMALESVLKTPIKMVTREQMFWVANVSYDHLGVYVAPVYTALGKNRMKALVPWDNWLRAVRERGIPESYDEVA
jgi:hypothetical protein